MSDSVSSESRSVVRDADDNGTAIGDGLVDAVRDGNTDGIGAEVVIMNGPGSVVPTSAMVF